MVAVLVALLAGCGASAARAAPAPARLLMSFSRGAGRPLPTTIWLPADLAGRHPIVLFSHGLGGSPAQFASLASTWTAAGFVVVAAAYPHTHTHVKIDPADVRNQPADAEFVLRRVLASPLAAHLDANRIVAAGFSAGGTTTLGLLHPGHLAGLRGAVSVAGRRPRSSFGGTPVPVLFVHGDHDPTVPLAAGRQAYAALPWPKTFVTVPGGEHGDYLNPGNPAYAMVTRTILDFLRGICPE